MNYANSVQLAYNIEDNQQLAYAIGNNQKGCIPIWILHPTYRKRPLWGTLRGYVNYSTFFLSFSLSCPPRGRHDLYNAAYSGVCERELEAKSVCMNVCLCA